MNVAKRLLAVAVSVFLAVPAFCTQAVAEDESSDYSYGEVVKATDQGLTVLEYDYEMDQERAVDYSVSAATSLNNVAKAGQLAKGDTVEIYFKNVNGAKVADAIIKDDASDPVDDQTPSP